MTRDARRTHPAFWCLLAGLIALALAPWWRNHGYLRDLFDYGLVLAANGHLDRGEMPYVDFTTPIQAGYLGLNWLIERAGGGTYAGLTRGGAVFIALSGLLLPLLLARRWPWWQAAAVGWAVTVAGAGQHTIVWHNALGLFCLAVVAWATAVAPVLRRETWPWHALALGGLVLGGFNKLNFQIVAVAVAWAWPIRAGLLHRSGWGRVVLSLLAVLIAGAVLPLAVELAWTGASVERWLDNVVRLAAGSRADAMRKILSPEFLLRPIHDYYGPLLLPQAGLAGLVLSLLALAGCWPATRGARLDRGLLLVAALGVTAAGAAFLATNYEIACLGIGAWLVMAVSMWLGFAPPPQRGFAAHGLLLATLVAGASAWGVAWRGLRSQFGYSDAPRSSYVAVSSLHPAYARLAGLSLPPELAESFRQLPTLLPAPGPDGRRPVFYAAGMESAERFFPGMKEPGRPLVMQWGGTYDDAARIRFEQRLTRDGYYQAVLCSIPFDYWPASVRALLERHYHPGFIGSIIRQWQRRDENILGFSDSLAVVDEMGGNLDSRTFYMSNYPLSTRRTADGRCILGTMRETGEILVTAPARRLAGLVVIDRLPGYDDGPLYADVKFIVHGANPEQARWAGRIELPAGVQTRTVPFVAEGPARALQLWIVRPASQVGRSVAGVRDLAIVPDAAADSEAAPQLRDGVPAVSPDEVALAASLFGPVAWRPQRLVVRGGRPGATGLELPPGTEAWLHVSGMSGDLAGELVAADPGRRASVRIVWSRAGRLDVLARHQVEPGHPVGFRVRPPEPGGWLGVLTEGGDGRAPALVRVTAAP